QTCALPIFGTGVDAIGQDLNSIDPHMFYTLAEMTRIRVGRMIDNGDRVKYNNVCLHSLAMHAAIAKTKSGSRGAGAFPHSILQRDPAKVAHVMAINSLEGAVGPRVHDA